MSKKPAQATADQGAAQAAKDEGQTAPRARARKPRMVKLSVIEKQEKFLRQFASVGNVTDAAQLAGVNRVDHYLWLSQPERWPDYQEKFNAAMEESRDKVRREVRRRGVVGWAEPVYGNRVDPKSGKSLGYGVVGTKHVYSDRMLELSARMWVPEAREKLELTGKDGGPVQTENLSALTDAQVEARLQMAIRVLQATAPPLQLAGAGETEGAAQQRAESAEEAYEAALRARNGGKKEDA